VVFSAGGACGRQQHARQQQTQLAITSKHATGTAKINSPGLQLMFTENKVGKGVHTQVLVEKGPSTLSSPEKPATMA
jgi:hypothetical protein